MALKGDRNVIETDLTQTCDTATERGVVLVGGTNGSGVAIGNSAGGSTLVAAPSGYVVTGLLLNDVVSVDLTRYHLNFHKDEVPVNQRVLLLRKGRVTTNKIIGTPNAGDIAYLDSSGNLTPTPHATGGIAAKPKVGRFISKLDENGYAAVDVALPVA